MSRTPVLLPDLSNRGLEAELIHPGNDVPAFKSLVMAEMMALTKAAYGNEITEAHIKNTGYCLIIKENDVTIAGCLIDFESYPSAHFYTRMEAVMPDMQRKGIGRLLFRCVETAASYLTNYEYFIYAELSMDPASESGFYLVATIDRSPNMDDDNTSGHGAFMRKVGFVRSNFDWECGDDCVEFCRFVAY